MIVFTRPDHDSLTNYLKIWMENLVKQSKNLGVSVVDLYGLKASRGNFISYLKSGTKKNFICFNGHGNEGIICGFEDKVLIDQNDFRTKKKINVVYARSCRVGAFLGKKMVDSGLKCFIGYDYNFVVYMKKDCALKPLSDDLAKRFIEPSNYIIYLLLKKKTALEADMKSKEMMKKEVVNLLSSGSNEDLNIASYLYSNLKHQVVIGDESTRIFD